MKRVIALLLSLVMMVSTLTGCADGHFKFAGEDSLTRGQWIALLAGTFGMDEYMEETPHLSDVSSKDDIFAKVQSCFEWGVLRDVSDKLKKNDAVTLEFAISTAVYAIENDLSAYEGKTDLDKALEYARLNGIAPLVTDYKARATTEQCSDILSAAQYAYLNAEITPVNEALMLEGVSDQRETENIEAISDDEYVISNIKPNVGDVMIAPGTKENPDGVAIKIVDVIDNGNGTYSVVTETPEIYEVFESLEYAGVAVPEFDDIIPAEGVEIVPLENSSAENVNSGATKVSMFASHTAKRGGITEASKLGTEMSDVEVINTGLDVTGVGSKDAPLGFTANINFTKGTLKLNPTYGSQSLGITSILPGRDENDAENGKLIDAEWNSVFGPIDKVLKEEQQKYYAGEITKEELHQTYAKYQEKYASRELKPEGVDYKFTEGYELVGSISIKNFYIVPQYKLKTLKVFGIDTGVPTGIQSFSVETNYTVESSLSLKGKSELEISLCKVPVSLGGIGVLTIDFLLCVDINGEISVKATLTNNTKAEYYDGNTRKTATQTRNLSGEIEVECSFGPKVEAKFSAVGIELFKASVAATVDTKISMTLTGELKVEETKEAIILTKNLLFNSTWVTHIPVVVVELGTSGELKKLVKIEYKWTVIGPEGKALITAPKIEIGGEPVVLKSETETIAKQVEDETYIDSNMSIDAYYIYLQKGETMEITLDLPDGYEEDDFVWSSSNSKVVTVKNGKITGKKDGIATIRAESKDGKHYASCAVRVGDGGDDEYIDYGGDGSGAAGGGGVGSR